MTGEATEAFELFYSYAHEDERLLKDLNNHLYNLKRQGLIVDWYDRDISAGTDWEQEIDGHLNSAQVILLLVSPAFMASDYCFSIEMKRALERHETGEARVIPILLKTVDWTEAPFSKLQVLPRNRKAVSSWRDRNAAFVEIANNIRETLKDLRKSSSTNRTLFALQVASPPPFPATTIPSSSPLEEVKALAPVWNVPYPRNLRFTDREEILQHLHEYFTENTANITKQPLALSGLGGMGKTQIALEYSYRFQEEYPIILWAKADSQETLTSELASFAMLLKVPGQQEQDQQYALIAVKRWLEVHPNWLLILDNVENLQLVKESLPTSLGGYVLITTRSQIMYGVAKRLDIDKMELDDGALLLLRRIGLLAADASLNRASEQQCKQAREIVTMLGGHPLAIDQAGAYIDENGGNLQRYPELYSKRRTYLLTIRGDFSPDHPESVTTTLSLAFEKVEQSDDAALELLYCLAFLHPDTIPDELLERGASALGPRLQTVISDTIQFERAIGELRKYSLVRRHPDGATLTLHRLVQDVLKDSMDSSMQRQWAERIIRTVNQAFPIVEFANWEICQEYLPQVQHCSQLIRTGGFTFPEAAQLLYKGGKYLGERGQYAEASKLIKQSLAIREQTLGMDHPDVAESLNELAFLDWQQGHFTAAESFIERALMIREQVLGHNHPDTALSLAIKALIYLYNADYSEAESLFKRALAIREQVLGPNHPDTAQSQHDLALLYDEQAKYSKAESLMKRALAIREQVLGPNHPDTILTTHGLAWIYKNRGRYSEAESLMKSSLAIREQVLGPNHPDMASGLNNLAVLYEECSRYSEAEPLMKQALDIIELVLGPNHPNAATSLSNLASIYKIQGRYSEAESLSKRAISIQEQRLRPNHPDMAASLNTLAGLYKDQGRYSEAESLLKQALDISTKAFGLEHPLVINIMRVYAQLLWKTNRKGRAAELESRLNTLNRNISKRK